MPRFLLLCFLLVPTPGCAQLTTIAYARRAPVILKLAPLWLLDADPALMGGLEIRTGPRTSVQGEFGYGRPGWGNLSAGNQHAGTWRLKAEMRFYRNRYRTNLPANVNVTTTYPLGNYWAVEAYTKLLNIDHHWTYTGPVYDPTVPPQTGESRQTLIRRNSVSLTAKVGRQFGWTDNAHQGTARLLWDVYAGIGIRLTHQSNDGQWATPGFMPQPGMFYNRFNTNGLSVTPTLSAGLKLGFAL